MRTVLPGRFALPCDPSGVTFPTDPLAPIVALPGVAAAVERARDALVELHNHPVNRRGWPATAAEASLRAARASAALDGAPLARPDDAVAGPVLAGAVRVAEEQGRLLGVWRTSPAAGAGPAARARRRRPRRRAGAGPSPARRRGRGPPRAARGSRDRRYGGPRAGGRRGRPRRAAGPGARSVRPTAWWPARRVGWRRWRPGWTRKASRCRRSGTCADNGSTGQRPPASRAEPPTGSPRGCGTAARSGRRERARAGRSRRPADCRGRT